jgi:glucose/mannose-6-phosphate isomerase
MQYHQDNKLMQQILDFPEQFRFGFEAAENIGIKKNFKGAIICGMGGSGLPGEILKIWLGSNKISLPIILHKNYDLPFGINKDYLIVCISYSGNTEETISAYRAAKKKNLSIISITSGGKLARFCKKDKSPAVIIRSGIVAPRLAIAEQFAALLKILNNCDIIKNNIKDLLFLEKNLEPKNLENKGKKIAKKLVAKIPFIYSPENLKILPCIWKIGLNESAKIVANAGYFPELSHHEIMCFKNVNKKQLAGKKLFVIFLKDAATHPRILKQMKIVQDLLKKQRIETESIQLEGKNILEKIFSNIILAFWTSYYLALEYEVDPIKIKLIDELKKRMAR